MNALRTPSDQTCVPRSGTHRAEARVPHSSGQFGLRVISGAPPRQAIVTRTPRLVIGHGPPADFCLADASVSQTHCEIVSEGGAFLLTDLGSETGTRVGNVRVKSVYLPCESRIVVGAVELAFEILEDQAGVGARAAFGRLLGVSAPMRTIVERLSRLAPRDTTLLLEGESGTGKRLAAEVAHAAGPRRARPLVVVDCRRSHSPSVQAAIFRETPCHRA